MGVNSVQVKSAEADVKTICMYVSMFVYLFRGTALKGFSAEWILWTLKNRVIELGSRCLIFILLYF